MNIAKHMEAIVIVAAVALTSAAAIASPAGRWHTGDAAETSIGNSDTLVVNGKGLTATLAW
ncbi:hypothetical protein [Massilia cavernae]|uniref:hypothetical protein n=1 Tax=Massilia cavernae TaxID=2320864 RepID=UPI000E6C6466|nr:hypothetical protein [Massilia cavernae]